MDHGQQYDEGPSLVEAGPQVVWLCVGILIPPTVFVALQLKEIVFAFKDFLLRVIPKAD